MNILIAYDNSAVRTSLKVVLSGIANDIVIAIITISSIHDHVTLTTIVL